MVNLAIPLDNRNSMLIIPSTLPKRRARMAMLARISPLWEFRYSVQDQPPTSYKIREP